MPCHLPATSASLRRRPPSLRLSPPRILAVLNLQQPGEREAMDTLNHYTTGKRRVWKVLAMRRNADGLRIAVEWLRRRASPWFASVSIGFADGVVDVRFQKSERAARAALVLPRQTGGARG